MRRYKRIIGDALKSLHDDRRTTEVAIAVKSLNRMNELGCRFTLQDGTHPFIDFNEVGETEVYSRAFQLRPTGAFWSL
jgi:hypothetical protein